MSVPTGGTLRIREVWAENLEEEFELIRSIVDDYPYLAMDTEFPGVVVRPVGSFRSSAEYHYQTLRMNVDMLKLIQLGLTFTDSDGLLPTFDDEFEEGGEGEDKEGEEGAVRGGGGGGEGDGKQENGSASMAGAGEAAAVDGVEEKEKKERKKKGAEKETRVREYCVWQFNFREFSLRDDMYAHDSIELLKQSGIDFARNEAHGVEYARFAELLMSSGVVLNESVHWITFHSGYDFGYLLKLLTGGAPLPPGEAEFFALLRVFFPTLYDIKHLMRFCDNLHGGLNRLAEALDVVRIGPQHQAGSDSLLTSAAFRKLTQHMGNFFSSHPERYQGVLYGLGADGGNSSGNPVTAE